MTKTNPEAVQKSAAKMQATTSSEQKRANEALVPFIPDTDFVGDPFGDGTPVHFRAGIPSSPVPAGFAANPKPMKTAEADKTS